MYPELVVARLRLEFWKIKKSLECVCVCGSVEGALGVVSTRGYWLPEQYRRANERGAHPRAASDVVR